MAKKSEDRRRSILNAALDEFEAKGFSAALVEDIAHRAGVSKGTIYGYFKGKEALLLGLAEEVAVLIQKEFDQPSEHASLPLIERLWRTEAGLLADNGHGRQIGVLHARRDAPLLNHFGGGLRQDAGGIVAKDHG